MSITLDYGLFVGAVLIVGFVSTFVVVSLVNRAIRQGFKLYHDDDVTRLLQDNKAASEKLSGQLEIVRRLMDNGHDKERKP